MNDNVLKKIKRIKEYEFVVKNEDIYLLFVYMFFFFVLLLEQKDHKSILFTGSLILFYFIKISSKYIKRNGIRKEYKGFDKTKIKEVLEKELKKAFSVYSTKDLSLILKNNKESKETESFIKKELEYRLLSSQGTKDIGKLLLLLEEETLLKND